VKVDMEVRCAALRMEYQKRMVRSNFIGKLLIFCFFCIKVKDEELFFFFTKIGAFCYSLILKNIFSFSFSISFSFPLLKRNRL
jgi:hypothetical protein